MFEIGKRMNHVKDNKLFHGEWLDWLKTIDIHPRVAQQMIKVAANPSLNTSTYSHLGLKALYEIATMPADERDKPQVIQSTGETKNPSDMTVRELQEVTNQLKEAKRSKDETAQRANN